MAEFGTAGMDLQPGSLVWYQGPHYLLPGVVKGVRGDNVSLQNEWEPDSEVFTMAHGTLKQRTGTDDEGVEDMIQLSDLHEGGLIYNIKKRYLHQRIYTYTGSILVAVNPYQVFDMYGVDVVRQYEGRLIGKLPPHIFALGNAAYSHMRMTKENQCMIVSGESGAGKTESTKLIMQYLAAVNKDSSNLISEQILEANPLLESFGNAKTIKNNNSSRFGKYLEIFFDKDGVIEGAKISQYLLERSRIVFQAPDERNYHVFYEMLAGLPKADLEKYGLGSVEDYFYLTQGNACTLDNKDEVHDFNRLSSAMEVLGMQSTEKESLFRMLAAVLQLGNMFFGSSDKNGQEAAVIESPPETLQSIGNLLGGPAEKYELSITNKITVCTNNITIYPYTTITYLLDGPCTFVL